MAHFEQLPLPRSGPHLMQPTEHVVAAGLQLRVRLEVQQHPHQLLQLVAVAAPLRLQPIEP